MTIVLTGANRGLGHAILIGLAQSGYDVIACVRNNEQYAEDFASIAQTYGVQIHSVECHLDNKESIDSCWEEIEKLEMDIYGLVNCAGIMALKPVMFTSYEDVEQMFRINYFAPFEMCKRMAEIVVRRGSGAIVNISSMASLGSQPGGAAYDASKASLNQLTKTLAQELAPFSVRCNAVACGPINTEMFSNMGDKEKNKLIKSVAMKRAAEPEEIVKTVLFLLSEDSSFITGQIIRVDGGAII